MRPLGRRARVDPEVFERRLLTDLFIEVSADQALKRAETFLWAAPTATDWRGRATDDELRARRERCHAVAAACRAKAAVIERYGLGDDIGDDVKCVLYESRGAA